MKINEKLLNIIKEYIVNKSYDFSEFYKNFEAFYMNDSFNNEFEKVSDSDNDFFAEVWNKAEWTIKEPQQQDLDDGYISYKSFSEWLRVKFESYKQETISLRLNKKEALILLNLLEKIDTSDLDEAEKIVFSGLESLLEKEVTETFSENYNQILEGYKKDILG